MRFRLQPLDDTGPRRLERILPSTPVSRRSLARPVRRPHLASAPSQRQAPQKAVEVGIALRHRMNRRACSQSGQVMLNRTDLVQQPERVHGAGQRPQTVLHRGGNRVRGEQPRTRRLRRVVALVDAGADPCLLGELERRLEHVHEQARRRVQAGQRFGPGHAFQTAIPHQAADDRAVLLLDPRLVVLPIRPRPRQLDVVLLAEADQHLVEKLAAVVSVDSPQRKREGAAEPIHRVDHHTCFTHQQRYGLRPAAGDIGQHQRPDEAAGHRRATVRDQVGLDEARRRILPIAERAHRNPAPYALAPGTTAPTLTGRHRPRRRQAAVYRRGADRHELLAHLRVQGQVPMPLECRHQDRQQRLQALPAHTV